MSNYHSILVGYDSLEIFKPQLLSHALSLLPLLQLPVELHQGTMNKLELQERVPLYHHGSLRSVYYQSANL
jgi:hypothetical protein